MTPTQAVLAALSRLSLRRHTPGALTSMAAILALLLAVPAAAQMPADAVLRDFEPTGEYILEVDGAAADGAEIYRSSRAAAILLITGKLPSPTLLRPGAGTAHTVSVMQLARRDSGNIDFLASAELVPAGRFELGDDSIRFTVGGKEGVLRPKPHLLGLHPGQALLDDKPEYSRRAEEYTPYEPSLQLLRGVTDTVKVRVYFGSWCPACARMVPPLIKVTEALEGSAIEFEFYGLPTPFANHTDAKRDGVHGVPTGIVYRGGKEIGRISRDGWRIPESTLAEILTGKSKA